MWPCATLEKILIHPRFVVYMHVKKDHHWIMYSVSNMNNEVPIAMLDCKKCEVLVGYGICDRIHVTEKISSGNNISI